MEIRREPEKRLTVAQEIALARMAFARSPTAANRRRLGRLLALDDAFEDLVALMAPHDDLSTGEALMLADAYFAREDPESNALAVIASDQALAAADADPMRAAALAMRGKAETRLGRIDAARATLIAAIDLDPANKDACKRLAALDLASDAPAEVIAFASRLADAGANHARLFAAQALAEARLGDIDAARATSCLDRFPLRAFPAPPPGWTDVTAFNDALAAELTGHPGMRYERYGSASALTWRVENPARADTPCIRALVDAIVEQLHRFVHSLEGSDHPWATARPTEAWLRTWCVITESDGFENWHVHQFGWLSGVYYVRVPESIARGNSNSGCLAFGLPEDLAGEAGAAAFGEQIVRPQEGLMLAFPSHAYHRTYPHGTGEKRICLAFDVRPLDTPDLAPG